MSGPPPPPPMPTGPLGQYTKATTAAAADYERQFKDWATAYRQFNFEKLHLQLTSKGGSPKATYYSDDESQQYRRELSLWAKTWEGVSEGIVVIENLNLEWMQAVNNEFGVDQDFFRHHIVISQVQLPDEIHLDCTFRAINKTSLFGSVVESKESLISMPRARLSCRALKPGLFILLVSMAQDPNKPMPPRASEYEVTLSPSCNDPPAKLVVSSYNASESYHDATGEFQPPLFLRATTNALFTDFQRSGFLTYLNWNVKKQSSTSHKSINNNTADVALCWLLTICIWKANLSAIDRLIEEASYKSVVEPTRKTLNELAELRRAIADVRAQIARTRQDVPINALQAYDQNAQNSLIGSPKIKSSAELFDSLGRKMAEMRERLNESTQFLIGSITVNDADLSLKQANEANNMARRATALTVLAAIYLPLSLVTSVFGMNIAQLDPVPQWWAVLIALAVVFPPTVLFVGFALRSRKQHNPLDGVKMSPELGGHGISEYWGRWNEKNSSNGGFQTGGNIV